MNKDENLPKCEFAFIDSVINVNFKPHPFTIGPRHVTQASKHYSGILSENVCREIPCAASPRCTLSYDEHKSDKVGFIKLTRNCSQEELQVWLKETIAPFLELNKIDGVAFIETGFRWS